jgi:hypothetical protein
MIFNHLFYKFICKRINYSGHYSKIKDILKRLESSGKILNLVITNAMKYKP